MSKTPRGLGKGLGALLGENTDISSFRKPVEYINKTVVTSEQPQNTADIMLIPVGMIEPNPFQPRSAFDQDAMEELADSIRTLGLIQPITVRKKSHDRYQIISGERRFRASKMAGMNEIPAYIRETDDQGMLEMAIVENIQREDLDPIEVALSYQRLIEECSLTQEQMATRVGKKRASVTNYLRLLRLPAKIQHDLKVGLLSVGHAKVLLGVENQEIQEKLCDLVIKEELSVRQLENMIRKMEKGENPKDKPQEQDLPEDYFKVLEIVGKYFTNNISLKRNSSGKGTMTIHFSSDEEISKFLKALEESSI
ncbi:MAG: ParB/RepB/Spo0J family partition protein [Bacteroidetes bacterium]|uniref:ParB/RepB/Spo0J family partition protein n=1 Tax=Candidatus Cryptobacteroides faecigallinarum TaxID=2840763 RepID=A0A9D9IM14_9BACT|nr:ParB/RepB/Spo0J family partition protein [Candidatus Cryptobacteroides faecigallinarum]